MSAPAQDRPGRSLVLPPLFIGIAAANPAAVHRDACALASGERAGTLLHADDGRNVGFAVVLAPEEPLWTARRAFLVGMTALADAVGAHAPPEKAIRLVWPDGLRFNEAGLGGGRLAWPGDCPEEAVPDWLVFSAMLIASKRHAGDPGLTPDTTSIEEEVFEVEDRGVFVESFARYLMKAFEIWAEDGFEPLGAAYRAYLPDGEAGRLTAAGDLAVGDGVRPLRAALEKPAWLDPATGSPRL
ncbi:biotin/lipoate--protein ligase family protein [Methylobacterium nigriterrae]|uniref:biotin/lipoate--protein ligase family protein n=1 Tax=Methylobacterium nigriterrae TaxID=3127512 RepID=UPI003D67390E